MSSSGAEHDDAVPPALRERIRELLGKRVAVGEATTSAAQLAAAIEALAMLVAKDPSQHSALELLAIDALATGAFASASDPLQLEALANRAFSELTALGNGGNA